MSEGPTAEPEPVPWGTEADPFPVGTVITMPAPEHAPTEYVGRTVEETHPSTDSTTIVEVPGACAAKEIQGRIEHWDWRIGGYKGGDDER